MVEFPPNVLLCHSNIGLNTFKKSGILLLGNNKNPRKQRVKQKLRWEAAEKGRLMEDVGRPNQGLGR